MLRLFWECIGTSTLQLYTLLYHKHVDVHYTHPQTRQLLNCRQKETHPNKADNKDIHGLDHSGGSGLMTTKQARLIDCHDFTWVVSFGKQTIP